MDKTEVVKKLNTAVEHAVPDVKKEIMQRCKREKDATVPMLFERKRRRTNNALMTIVAAAAVLFLAINLGFSYQKQQVNNTVSVVVDLDVNPSIELRINAEDRIVEVHAINQDAQDILSGMDLTGAKTNVAVNAVLGAMLKNGYLNENSNSILVSVDAKDSSRSQQLQEELVTDIDSMLQACSVEAAILSQTVTQDPNLTEWSETYGISQGKASLIQKIIENNPQYTVDDLVELTINELNLLLSSQQDLSNTISSTGTASEKSYIGQDAALAIVMNLKGLAESDVTELVKDIEVFNSRMVYGISFCYENMCYIYKIDALTGEVTVSDIQDPSEIPASTNPGSISQNITSTDPVSNNSVSANATEPGVVSGNTVSSNVVSQNSVSGNQTGITDSEARTIGKTDASLSDNDITQSAVTLKQQNSNSWYIVELYTTTNCYYYEIDPVTGALLTAEVLELDRNGNAIISENQAKNIVLAHARLSAESAVFDQIELIEKEQGYVYDITFSTRTNIYHYTIDAVTRSVLDYSKSSVNAKNTQDS